MTSHLQTGVGKNHPSVLYQSECLNLQPRHHFLEQSDATVVDAVTNGIAPAAKMVSIVHLHVGSAGVSPA